MAVRVEKILSLVLLALLAIGCLWVLKPFLTSALWAGIICYSSWPAFVQLERLTGNRRGLSALLMTLAICAVVVVPFVVVGLNLADGVRQVLGLISRLDLEALKEPPAWVSSLPLVGESAARYWTDALKDTSHLTEVLRLRGIQVGTWLLVHSVDVGRGIALLVLSAVMAFFIYRDGEALVERVAAMGKRIAGDDARRVQEIVGRTVRGVVYGIIGTGLAQAVLAWLGFMIAGVSSAVLLGVVTFVVSLVPVGPPLVWFPTAAWLFFNKGAGWGIFMFIWGLLAVSGIDNFLKPILISREAKLPFILIFLGALGGVLAFGFVGLFIGPTLLAVAHSLVRTFASGKPEAEGPRTDAKASAGAEARDPRA